MYMLDDVATFVPRSILFIGRVLRLLEQTMHEVHVDWSEDWH